MLYIGYNSAVIIKITISRVGLKKDKKVEDTLLPLVQWLRIHISSESPIKSLLQH